MEHWCLGGVIVFVVVAAGVGLWAILAHFLDGEL